MKIAKTFLVHRVCVVSIAALLCCLAISAIQARAQTGDNGVCNSASSCTTTSSVTPSAAFLDATSFTGADFCRRVNNALKVLQTAGIAGVVDARGVNSGNAHTCQFDLYANPTTITVPSVVLLPSGTITISATWNMPNGSRLIGEGAGACTAFSSGLCTAATGVTTIQASSSFPGSRMIQMGSSTLCPSSGCFGVSIEDVMVDGNSQNLTGILNGSSQDSSYVNRVTLYRILGVGLQVGNPISLTGQSAINSGPYSNINCYVGGSGGSSATACLSIAQTSTRGVRGLTGSGNSTTASSAAAVQVDNGGNSIEDVSIQGFEDGIRVAGGQNLVLFNVTGGTSVSNVVHLESTSGLAKDLVIQGVSNGGNSSSDTIKDDVTTTALADTYVGTYILGEAVTAGGSTAGYSRFTSSPGTSAGDTGSATWGVGSSSTGPSGSCASGSMFSDTNPSASHTLWVCKAGSWTTVL